MDGNEQSRTDMVARLESVENSRGRAQSRGERKPLVATLELGKHSLKLVAGGVARSGVHIRLNKMCELSPEN